MSKEGGEGKMERDWSESKLSSFFLLALSLLSPSLPPPPPLFAPATQAREK